MSVGTPLLLTLTVLTLFLAVRAATVQVLASDTSAIQYTSRWVGPTVFELIPGVDDVSAAGPNSSVCTIPEASMYSGTDGESFSFSFHGIAIQLVLSSRPDHTPYGVSVDGGPEEQMDSYSDGARCGVAWSREGLSLGNHTVRATVHTQPPRIFLELLSILYDDGSDIVVPPPAPPPVPKTRPKPTPTPTPKPAPSASPRPRPSSTTTQTSAQSSLVSSASASASASSSSSSSSGSSTATNISTPPSSEPASTTSSPSSAPSPNETVSAAVHSQGVTLARGPVIGIAASCGLAALLGVLVLVLMWRRRRVRRAQQVRARIYVYPDNTGSNTSVVEKRPLRAAQRLGDYEVSSPTDTPGTSTPSRYSAPVPARGTESMRLAPEDIDRIAARMHDVLTTARLGDSDNSVLPPY